MKHSLLLYTFLSTTPVVASPGRSYLPEREMFAKAFDYKESITRQLHANNFYHPQAVLTDFSAIIQSDSVMLKWSVCGDTYNEYFEVERSTNARNWKIIAHVNTVIPGGFNESYYEAGEHPVRGQAYYRLKQVNPDGSSKYSKTIAVYYSGRYRSKKSIPVSSSGTVLIKKKILTPRAMELYTEAGHRMIFETSIVGDDTKLTLGNVSNGVYILRINKGVAAPSIIKLIKN